MEAGTAPARFDHLRVARTHPTHREPPRAAGAPEPA
jgi:hypothetical protein